MVVSLNVPTLLEEIKFSVAFAQSTLGHRNVGVFKKIYLKYIS